MKVVMIPRTGAADINQTADTTNSTFEAPFDGRLNIEAMYIEWTEATGSQTTTQGVISIEVAGTEVATLTANQSDAIGETQTFTVDGTEATAAQPFVEFDAGDDIECITKTQAVDGTVTGDGTIYMPIEYAI